jgi:hypothetical protein
LQPQENSKKQGSGWLEGELQRYLEFVTNYSNIKIDEIISLFLYENSEYSRKDYKGPYSPFFDVDHYNKYKKLESGTGASASSSSKQHLLRESSLEGSSDYLLLSNKKDTEEREFASESENSDNSRVTATDSMEEIPHNPVCTARSGTNNEQYDYSKPEEILEASIESPSDSHELIGLQ